jgi:hypothetical protein
MSNKNQAEEALDKYFPHIDDSCKLKQAERLMGMENDLRKVLNLGFDGMVSLWIIDAIVCHYTERGSEFSW